MAHVLIGEVAADIHNRSSSSGDSIFLEMSAIKSALSGCLDFCCYFPVIPIYLFVCLLYLVSYTLAVLAGSLKRLLSTLYALSSLFRLILDLQFFFLFEIYLLLLGDECFAWVDVCAPHTCLRPLEARTRCRLPRT